MKVVEYYVRDDGWILAYLPSADPNIWIWDETYYTTQREFLDEYKDYVRIDATEEMDKNDNE